MPSPTTLLQTGSWRLPLRAIMGAVGRASDFKIANVMWFLQTMCRRLGDTGIVGAMMGVGHLLQDTWAFNLRGDGAHWQDLGACWLLASMAGALSTGVRICRRLQRVNRSLSILPSHVQQGASAFILEWEDVEMLPRHLGAFEVGYEAVIDSESHSHQHRVQDNGCSAGWIWRKCLQMVIGDSRGLDTRPASPQDWMPAPVGPRTKGLWNLLSAGSFVGCTHRLKNGNDSSGGDGSAGRSWLVGCRSVQFGGKGQYGLHKGRRVGKATVEGVQLSLSGLRPGMVYRLQIVGISSDGVRGAPSMVFFLSLVCCWCRCSCALHGR